MEDGYMKDSDRTESWICPKCGQEFIAVLNVEDVADGCKDGVTWCYTCLSIKGMAELN